jgi:hypothetical protein
VKVYPSDGSGDTGGPGWVVLTAEDGGNVVILSWGAAHTTTTGYEVSIDGQIIDVGLVNEYEVSGLVIGQDYVFKVRAYDTNNLKGGWSAPLTAQASGFNLATGGTETDVPDYNGTGETWRVHTFNSNADFVVSNASLPFEVLWVGGGGGGCSGSGGNGNSGAGGRGGRVSETIAVGTWPVVIGGGGSGGDVSNAGGGGQTTFHGHTGDGGPGGTSGSTPGGGLSITDTISGVSVNYGHNAWPRAYTNMPNGPGGGGGGGELAGHWGAGGAAGQVVVAYRIA